MKHFLLYGTSACHLCDQAQLMLADARRAGGEFSVETVDISDDDTLFAAYGLTIPVIRAADGRELNWPFAEEVLADFLAA